MTLSKYPPYRCGHAKQALWNNRALALLTGQEQHQVTYCGLTNDPADEAGPGVRVHHVANVRANPRNADGQLARAISAELYRVAAAKDVDAILTYYIDPHAAIANRVASAMGLVGKRPVVIHSIGGRGRSGSRDPQHRGAGSLGESLATSTAHLANLKVLCGIDYQEAQCLRATCAVGVFPTRIIQGFVETFCISALEYQALGAPVLATAVGGVPEATPGESALIRPDSPVGAWWNRLTDVLTCQAAHAEVAATFAASFTSDRSAARILDIAALGAQRRGTFVPLT